jgi:integral membrane protein
MRNLYTRKIESAQFFTDREAWNLFRLAAFGEAFGWTLLISSLVFKHYITPGNNIPVDIAGQVHGTIFLVYIAAVIILHPSLGWSPKRTLIAGLVSVPPYGTLVFEQWAAHQRHKEAFSSYRQLVVRGIIAHKGQLLAMQPQESGFWYMPGGQVASEESVKDGLRRIVTEQTGIKPTVGRLVYVWQNKNTKVEQLELFFMISNVRDYVRTGVMTAKKGPDGFDEVGFIEPGTGSDLQPEFLRSRPLPQSSTAGKVEAAIFI